MSLEDRVVIITGGGTGIGRAAALQCAHAGAFVLITGRRREPVEETAATHPRIEGIQADASDPADAVRVVREAMARWERIDAVVNNAASMARQSLAEAQLEVINRIFATNVIGTTLMAQAALPELMRTRGAIVNVSSTYGHKAVPHIGHYAASKAAVEHLTRCWALELAGCGIRVNAVAPGPTDTPALSSFGLPPDVVAQIKEREAHAVPLKRRGTADEVAGWIVRLLSPDEQWVTGQVIAIDGGLSVA